MLEFLDFFLLCRATVDEKVANNPQGRKLLPEALKMPGKVESYISFGLFTTWDLIKFIQIKFLIFVNCSYYYWMRAGSFKQFTFAIPDEKSTVSAYLLRPKNAVSFFRKVVT